MARNRPPFLIPPTSEILATPSNGLNMIGTFSGTGGSSLGYRWAGFETLVATEFVEEARKTYSANFGADAVVLPDDVRDVSGKQLVDAAEARFRTLHPRRKWRGVDVLEGSPPCSAFSSAGARSKNWGTTKSYSDTRQSNVEDLFFEFVRLVDEIRPKVFTGENVPGLIRGASLGYYFDIIDAFRSIGYRTEAKIVDAQWLGVPQARRRLFFIGVRDDLERDPIFPTPLPYRYSIADAFHDLPDAHGDDWCKTFEEYSIFDYWTKLGYGGSPATSRFNMYRNDPNLPSHTLTAAGSTYGAAGPTHSDEPRKYHIPEMKRLCGFPDDWTLTGSYEKRAERLARAVPPPMARAIASSVVEILKPGSSIQR